MSKKSFPAVTSQDEAWDDEVSDWRDILENQPFPITSYSNFGSLPPGNQNEEGLASIDTNNDVDYTGQMTLVGDGSSYKKLAWQSTEVAEIGTAPTITVPADSPATADALRDDLVTNALAEIQTSLNALYSKADGIIAALKNTGAMASA